MATDFDTALEMYRRNTLEYKVTGNSYYKTAADTSQKWLDDYLATMVNATKTDAAKVDKFVKDYADTNPELDKMQKQIKKVRTEGPKLQDVYETEQRAELEPEPDTTHYYTKAAIVGGVMAIAAVLSFF